MMVIGAPSQSVMLAHAKPLRMHCTHCTHCTRTAHTLHAHAHCTGAQFDTYQLDHNFGQCGHWGCDPSTPAERQYAWRFGAATARFARRLAVGQRLVYSSR